MVEGETLMQGYSPILLGHFASFDVFLDVIHHHNTSSTFAYEIYYHQFRVLILPDKGLFQLYDKRAPDFLMF